MFNLNKKSTDTFLESDKMMALSMYINTAYNIAMNPAFTDAGLYWKAIAIVQKVVDTDENFLAGYYCLACLYKSEENKMEA